jgi:hypothetical protein
MQAFQISNIYPRFSLFTISRRAIGKFLIYQSKAIVFYRITNRNRVKIVEFYSNQRVHKKYKILDWFQGGLAIN